MSETPDMSMLNQNVDKSQVLPIDQKRMVAFINEFIVSTVNFLNEFMTNAETKFVDLELKMQKIEASLLIVEAKMASIPDVDSKPATNEKTDSNQTNTPLEKEEASSIVEKAAQEPSNNNENENENKEIAESSDEPNSNGVKTCDDARYRKYFKMLQFGVPAPAVKLKMINDAIDPTILDVPNRILDDGVPFVPSEE